MASILFCEEEEEEEESTQHLLVDTDKISEGELLQTQVHALCFPQTHFSCCCSLRSERDRAECQLHWQAYARPPFLFFSLPFSLW